MDGIFYKIVSVVTQIGEETTREVSSQIVVARRENQAEEIAKAVELAFGNIEEVFGQEYENPVVKSIEQMRGVLIEGDVGKNTDPDTVRVQNSQPVKVKPIVRRSARNPEKYVRLIKSIFKENGNLCMTQGDLAKKFEAMEIDLPTVDPRHYIGNLLWRNKRVFERGENGYRLKVR